MDHGWPGRKTKVGGQQEWHYEQKRGERNTKFIKSFIVKKKKIASYNTNSMTEILSILRLLYRLWCLGESGNTNCNQWTHKRNLLVVRCWLSMANISHGLLQSSILEVRARSGRCALNLITKASFNVCTDLIKLFDLRYRLPKGQSPGLDFQGIEIMRNKVDFSR